MMSAATTRTRYPCSRKAEASLTRRGLAATFAEVTRQTVAPFTRRLHPLSAAPEKAGAVCSRIGKPRVVYASLLSIRKCGAIAQTALFLREKDCCLRAPLLGALLS